MIVSINGINITAENIEGVLSSIKRDENLKIIALSPITYANLNIHDLMLNKLEDQLFSDTISKTQCIIAPSKSTNLVKSERLKANYPSINNDDLFFSVILLSLNQGTLKPKESVDEKV